MDMIKKLYSDYKIDSIYDGKSTSTKFNKIIKIVAEKLKNFPADKLIITSVLTICLKLLGDLLDC